MGAQAHSFDGKGTYPDIILVIGSLPRPKYHSAGMPMTANTCGNAVYQQFT